MLKTSNWDNEKLNMVTYPFHFINWQSMHIQQTVCNVLGKFQCGKYLVAYILKTFQNAHEMGIFSRIYWENAGLKKSNFPFSLRLFFWVPKIYAFHLNLKMQPLISSLWKTSVADPVITLFTKIERKREIFKIFLLVGSHWVGSVFIIWPTVLQILINNQHFLENVVCCFFYVGFIYLGALQTIFVHGTLELDGSKHYEP